MRPNALAQACFVMKLMIVFTFFIVFRAHAYTSAQAITISFKNAPLENVFLGISKQTNYNFVYNNNVLKNTKSVDVNVTGASVEEVLRICLKNQPVSFKIVDRTIIIVRPEPTAAVPKQAAPLLETDIPPIPISGKVTDENGEPLVGVSVLVKGTNEGTSTVEGGVYKINVPENSSKILVFSYVGMEQQEVAVGASPQVNVVLKKQITQQEEIVIVGYGTQKKQAVTGAVVRANLKTYEKVPVNNIMETLKGTVAGLNVGEANRAGSIPGFTIRGKNTIAASESPLIVLDGIIFSGSLQDIHPSDIESVTILKDASAVAVFGARSANGVIMVETKKGSSIGGKPIFDFQASYGVVNELKRPVLYDAAGYLKRIYDILNGVGTKVTVEDVPKYLQQIEKQNYDATPDHQPTISDPYKLFRQSGFNWNNTLSISQRTDKTNYFISGSYTNQRGVVKNDLFKHYTIRANLDTKINDWLSMGIRAYYSFRDYPQDRIYGVSGSGGSVYLISPYASMYNTDGSYNKYPQSTTSYVNPFLTLATESSNRLHNLNGIFTSTVKVPWIKGLSYTFNYSQTLNINEVATFYSSKTFSGESDKGRGSRTYSRNNTELIDNILKYNKTFLAKHNVDLTLLYTTQKTKSYYQVSEGKGFDNDVLGTYRLQAAATQNVSTGGGESENVGQMARLTYTYDNRYSITGTVRKDGFSAFSANHKYVSNSSLGVNWNLTNEKFMQNVSWLSSLAIRASYGTNGNLSISPYSTLAKMSNGYYYFQGDDKYTYTQKIESLGNDNLKPETLTGLNAGIDFALFGRRLTGSIDGYLTRTNNLTFTLNLPGMSGFNSITANAGEVRNKGLEINLSSVNVKQSKFIWTSDAAFSINRNKVTHLLGDRNGDGKEDDIVSSNLFIGKSLGTVYDYKVIGMWQQSDVDNGSILKGFVPGTYKLLDVNNNGKITSDSDRVFLGNTNPNFRWSLTNTFTYGDFSLLVYLNSIWGGNNWFISGSNTPWADGYASRADLNHPVYDYWTPENPNAEFPRPSYKDLAMTKAPKYYDRSFIRLQKIALGYELTKYVKRWGLNACNLSVSADNLGTYAPHWLGLDAATASGLTEGTIPSLRTYTMRLLVSF